MKILLIVYFYIFSVVPPSMTLGNNGKHSGSSKASGTASISSSSIITVNGGLTGQSMNAPEREKVYNFFFFLPGL